MRMFVPISFILIRENVRLRFFIFASSFDLIFIENK